MYEILDPEKLDFLHVSSDTENIKFNIISSLFNTTLNYRHVTEKRLALNSNLRHLV